MTQRPIFHDFVAQCDDIYAKAAAAAESDPNRSLSLQRFQAMYLSDLQVPESYPNSLEVMHAVQDVLKAFFHGINGSHTSLYLKFDEIEALKDPYARWKAASNLPLTDIETTVLSVVADLSAKVGSDGLFVAEEISLEELLANENMIFDGHPIPSDRVVEVLGKLDTYQMVKPHTTIGTRHYAIRYCGAVRVCRTEVLEDERIDELRTQGEGDTLDYKRKLDLASRTEKIDFVRDITAMANAGGEGPRHLLIGVEDSGEFHVPGEDAKESHATSILGLRETTLQQIVRSYTTHSPSVRISAQGTHRFGPYALIEITRDIANLPYRVFRNEAERTASNAHSGGEIWIRKGSIKSEATPEEVENLVQLAERYRSIRTSGGES